MSGLPFSTDLDIRFDLAAAPPSVNPYSARQLRGTLSPIDAARGSDKLRRTVNGGLIDISAPQLRKYRLEVGGNDVAPPALDGLWVGMQVNVDCHVEFAYLTAGGTPGRTPVPGSPRVDGNFTYYRPRLSMLIADLHLEREEWAAAVSWSLSLEEM
jgi:hypothetical protein